PPSARWRTRTRRSRWKRRSRTRARRTILPPCSTATAWPETPDGRARRRRAALEEATLHQEPAVALGPRRRLRVLLGARLRHHGRRLGPRRGGHSARLALRRRLLPARLCVALGFD